MNKEVAIFDLRSRTDRDLYERLVNDPSIIILDESTSIGSVSDGEGGSDQLITRIVDYGRQGGGEIRQRRIFTPPI